jgi:hypothetical protein
MRRILAALSLALLSGSAHALTYTESSFLPVPQAHGPIPTSTTGQVFVDVSFPGLISGVSRSPWENTIYDGSAFTSIDSPPVGGSTATFDFGGPKIGLSLLWGSPDDYNKLDLLDAFDVIVGSITGAGFTPHAIGWDWVNISSDVAFNKVRLTSTGAAFEVANFLTTGTREVPQVPLPPAIAMFGGALAFVVGVSRRRRSYDRAL